MNVTLTVDMMYIMCPDELPRIVVATTLLPHEHPDLVVAATQKFFQIGIPKKFPPETIPVQSNPIRMISDAMSLTK